MFEMYLINKLLSVNHINIIIVFLAGEIDRNTSFSRNRSYIALIRSVHPGDYFAHLKTPRIKIKRTHENKYDRVDWRVDSGLRMQNNAGIPI